MKRVLFRSAVGILSAISLAGLTPVILEAQSSRQSQRHEVSSAILPRIVRQNGIAQLMVDGQPYLMVAGELHNSSASSSEYMRPIWEKLVGLHLNTVIGTVSWELVEPEENRFDFSTVDDQIKAAEQHHLRLVLIWFGCWKNASSSYAPGWLKLDPKRFPRADRQPGTTSSSPFGDAEKALTPFGDAAVAEDAKAFRALMQHIKTTDIHHTVIMMQVENEVGILGTSRDYSPLARSAWSQPVPAELMKYLVRHKASLLPELSSAWAANGYKESGTWAEVFGTNAASDEVFMSWAFGRALQKITAAGKQALPIPMYANAWLGPQPGQTTPGQYPSGGPVAGMLDVWRAAAPALDLFSPDIYIADFKGACSKYVRSGNPLFFPESRPSVPNYFWAVGQQNALGVSPFGVEDFAANAALAAANETLRGLAPLILTNRAAGKVMTVMEDDPATVEKFQRLTGLAISFRGSSSEMAKDLPPAPTADSNLNIKAEKDRRGFAMVIQTAPSEFIVAGSGAVIKNAAARVESLDEMLIRDNRLVPGRRFNGDERFVDNLFGLSSEQIQVRKIVTFQTQ